MYAAEIDPLKYLDKVPKYFLFGDTNVKNIEIPNNITSISFGAFYNCSSLTSVIIPDSVTSIGWYVFSGCSDLTSVIVPDSVIYIGFQAFYGCISLTSITYKSTIEDWKKIDKGEHWNDKVPKTCIIHCVDGDISAR